MAEKKIKKKSQLEKFQDKVDKKYSFIMVDLDELDIEDEYKRLKKDLKLDSKYRNFEALAQAIDFAAENARSAGNLFLRAKYLRKTFEEEDYRTKMAELYDEAIEALRRKKIGQLSDEKIKNWISRHHNEEYVSLVKTLRKLKFYEDTLKVLYDQWESRKSLLQSQGRMVEAKKTIVLGGDKD